MHAGRICTLPVESLLVWIPLHEFCNLKYCTQGIIVKLMYISNVLKSVNAKKTHLELAGGDTVAAAY
jgi:hypothetical protein